METARSNLSKRDAISSRYPISWSGLEQRGSTCPGCLAVEFPQVSSKDGRGWSEKEEEEKKELGEHYTLRGGGFQDDSEVSHWRRPRPRPGALTVEDCKQDSAREEGEGRGCRARGALDVAAA